MFPHSAPDQGFQSTKCFQCGGFSSLRKRRRKKKKKTKQTKKKKHKTTNCHFSGNNSSVHAPELWSRSDCNRPATFAQTAETQAAGMHRYELQLHLMLQDDLDTASKVYSCATQALRANREHDLKCTRFTRPHGEEKIRIESVGVKPESRAIHTAQSSPSSPNSTCRQRSCHGEIPVDTRYHLRGLADAQTYSQSADLGEL